MKQYRIQRSDHQGVVSRAFGGRVISWSAWRTVASFTDQGEAEVEYNRMQARGLSRWRIMYGKEIFRKSL
jgi:hypothetical protein